MALRTRIALTFLLLLAAVLAVALGAISAANRANAHREVLRQLDVGESVFLSYLQSNNRLLTLAAKAVAADYGFRDAVAQLDTDTLVSALQNHGDRIGAAMAVLTSLDGRVIAAWGSHATTGALYPITALQSDGASGQKAANVIVDSGRIYQLVAVPVKTPLPVAWIAVGFELNEEAALRLAKITHLGITLSTITGSRREVVSTVPAAVLHDNDTITREIAVPSLNEIKVVATLSRSVAEASASFAQLTSMLFKIAAVSLAGFAWAAFWIARNITRPLRTLTSSVSRMRDGNYDVALDVHRKDEIGVLAEGLQLMQAAVNSRDRSIRRLAYEDSLTGLMNRTAFNATLTAALDRGGAGTVVIAVINLNRFRRINEHLGYAVADELLKKIAVRLSAALTLESGLARLAADQFAAFARLVDATQVQAWGTSLLMALGEPILVEAQPIDVSATLGLAVASTESAGAPRDAAAALPASAPQATAHRSMAPPAMAPPADSLLRCADLALERARRDKKPLAIYEPSLKPVERDQLSLLGELARAVDHGELRLYFQPKVDLASRRVDGAEVLLRWQHPTRGLLGPAAFVPFAEQTGFIRRMTRWTLDRAIAQGAEWHRAGRPLALSVNISADDLADPKLDSRVAALLTRHQLPPTLLTLELTESGFIENPAAALAMLDALAALGVNLSIDDFGTGYSSLSHLARMPVNEIKIDKSFVQGLESDMEYAAIVRSAIDMGHSLGLKVVAEGIESDTAAQRLQSFGCDIAQGYLFARPMPHDELQTWLENKERVPVIAIPVSFNVDEVSDTLSLAIY